MTQALKLRINVMLHSNRIAAWFPDRPHDGKLFMVGTQDTHAEALDYVTRFMFARRLRKMTQRPLGPVSK